MANNKSNYLSFATLSLFLQNGNYANTSIYVALFTTTPAPSPADPAGVEVTGNGYARTNIIFDSGPFLDGAGNLVTHASSIIFPQASGGDWGTITGMALCDADTGGSYLYISDLPTPTLVADGDTAVFASGTIAVKES